MGSASSKVALNYDVASLAEPGQQSIISTPFDKYASAEDLFDALLQWFKDVKSPADGSAPKDLKIIEQSSEFTTVATWDGAMCRMAAYLYPLENVPREGDYIVKRRVIYDKAALTITDMISAGGADDLQLQMTATSILHKNPCQFEWFCVDKDGVRRSDATAAKALQAIIDDVFSKLEFSKASSGGA